MRSEFIERGGWWVAGQTILMLATVGLGVAFQGAGAPGALVACGAVLFALAGGIGIAGVIVLGGSRTPFPKPAANARLVRHGIYRFIRHPLYTSVMLAAIGWAGLWQSWPALVPALVLIPFFDAKARREERWLVEQFPEYRQYREQVRRFIPGIY